MSTDTIGIEGVSARYAAQIRELIYEQARKRLIAHLQAQREQAEAIRATINRPLEQKRSAPSEQPADVPHPGAASALSKTTGLVLDTSV